jgi:catechol 2,3-dioxygenase-like lactoylglutathione lyase family enzyme
VKRLHAVTLLVDEYDDAIAHYVDDLGFTLVEDTPLSPDKRWVRVSPDPDGGTSIVLAVATTDAQRKAIGYQTGGRVGLFLHMTEAPRIEIYGKVVVFRDRYGNLWDLIEPTAKTE